MKNNKVFLIITAITAHIIILSKTWLMLKVIAIIALTGILPAILLVGLLIGRSKYPLSIGEKCVYVIGVGYSIMIITMLLVSYLPGGVTKWHTFIAFDLVLLILFLLTARKPSSVKPALDDSVQNKVPISVGRYWLLIGFLSLLLIGGFFRFVNLGYSEFQGDEARAAVRAASVIQGYDDTLFFHKKGPAEILIPTVIYSLTGRLTEQAARLPFSLANLTVLFVVFLLGWYLFGPIAGWSAALLLALDGYFIAYSRILQYQSLVFLLSTLAVLMVYKALRFPEAMNRYFLLAALFFSTGLLAHYETITVLIPVSFLFWKIRKKTNTKQIAKALVTPFILVFILVSIFYIPFIIHPHFKITYTYIVTKRIHTVGSFICNNIDSFINRTTFYSTTYYLALMVVLTLLAILAAYRSFMNLRQKRYIAGFIMLCVVFTGFWLGWIEVIKADYVGLLVVLIILPVWLAPQIKTEEKMLWLWFGIPMLLTLFFVENPGNHVYIFFIPWVLISGMVINKWWKIVQAWLGRTKAVTIGIIVSVLTIVVFGNYAYWYFVHHKPEILRTWKQNRPKGYWVSYDSPDDSQVFDFPRFGFPHKTGWKALAVLYQKNILNGAYDPNCQRSSSLKRVRAWYLRDLKKDRENHKYFFLTPIYLGRNAGYPGLTAELEQKYSLFGTVAVDGEPRIYIYQKAKNQIEAQVFDNRDYEEIFNNELSGPFFHLDESVIKERD